MKICAIEPYDKSGYKNKIFEIHEMFTIIKDVLEKNEYYVTTFDLLSDSDSRHVDMIMVFSYNKEVLVKIQKYKCKKIYFAVEPEVVVPAHSKRNLNKLKRFFSAIYTPFDDSVDNIKIFKMNIPVNLKEDDDTISFDNKKLMCNVSGFKCSKHPLELYSLRRRVIDYYKNRNDFDFYGYGGWNTLGYSNYGGEIENKQILYHDYKFALCIENAININGYITEKIIDCFRSGIVPVYIGNDSTNKYIPTDCYIHMENYIDDLGELDKKLKQIDELQWSEYIQRGKRYLHNDCKIIFSYESFRRFFEVIMETTVPNMKKEKGSLISLLWISMIMKMISLKYRVLNLC